MGKIVQIISKYSDATIYRLDKEGTLWRLQTTAPYQWEKVTDSPKDNNLGKINRNIVL